MLGKLMMPTWMMIGGLTLSETCRHKTVLVHHSGGSVIRMKPAVSTDGLCAQAYARWAS